MTRTFDPAPIDKHAEKPNKAKRADKDENDELHKALEESFPASDPASPVQPKKSNPKSNPKSS